MQQDYDINFLVGDKDVLASMGSVRPLPIFSEEALSFLEGISRCLMASREAKAYPDLMTFAFWCRRASLRQMAKGCGGEGLRLGRGVAFHIPPSNVAMNFAYSFAAALLAGNASVVRLPSRDFPQVELLCRCMEEVLQQEPRLRPYVCLVRYGHEKAINDELSLLADVRLIWGGDKTIETIRQSPLGPGAREITFPDRFSLLVMGAAEYLRAEDKGRIAEDFYNDTYLTDQNACTSPRLIFWLGEQIPEAQASFWQNARDCLQKKGYKVSALQAIDKLECFCCLAAEQEARLFRGEYNVIFRVQLKEITGSLQAHMGNSGYFLEYAGRELQELLPLCRDKRCQTLSYYGVEKEKLAEFVRRACPRGIDRIVPLGRTMDFSLMWDGIDLIGSMSKMVMVE